MSADIDFSSLTKEQTLSGMGDLFLSMLATNRASIAVLSQKGEITLLNPAILAKVDPESLAQILLESWDEEEVEEFLGYVYG